MTARILTFPARTHPHLRPLTPRQIAGMFAEVTIPHAEADRQACLEAQQQDDFGRELV